jgi:hypothetical protein
MAAARNIRFDGLFGPRHVKCGTKVFKNEPKIFIRNLFYMLTISNMTTLQTIDII